MTNYMTIEQAFEICSPFTGPTEDYVYFTCEQCEEEYYMPEDSEACLICGSVNIEAIQ